MSEGRITELRLTAFKSFRDAVLPLEPMTILIGRNGSGKSNALEALGVLARLAQGTDLDRAVSGDHWETQATRGGPEACAPHGTNTFTLGVSVVTHDSPEVTLDITVQVEPHLRILDERLVAVVDGHPRVLLEAITDPERPETISARMWSSVQAENRTRRFSGRSLVSEEFWSMLMLADEGSHESDQRVMEIVDGFLHVLGGTFALVPMPDRMRGYVSDSDVDLRSSASNLPAVVARLQVDHPALFQHLSDVVGRLPEHGVSQLQVIHTPVGDVVLALREQVGRSAQLTSARQLSDGTLRIMAITTGLMTSGANHPATSSTRGDFGVSLLAVEELESGLHPSQAASLLDLVVEQSARAGFQVLVTTHSPTMLDALTGDQHHGVVVVQRDPASGVSTATRLSDLPGYLRMMARGSLGAAVTGGRVTEAAEPMPPMDPRSIDEILGIG